MIEDIESRGARLFHDLNSAFQKDPHIDEYGIIPVLEVEYNRSPVVLTQHKLGLESWSVPILYQYAYGQLFENLKHLDDNQKILTSRAVLLVNAECSTVWNIRKTLILNGGIDLKDELKFSALVLRKHPKSPETFSHRKWLFRTIGCEKDDGSFSLVELVANEMKICSRAADSQPCNYYAWSHRIWIIQNYNTKDDSQFLLNELTQTEKWVWMHISDHSGFHYRQFLLQTLKSSSSSSRKFNDLISQELELTSKMIKMYPDHEAIWYHRRFTVFSMIAQLKESFKTDQTKRTKLEFTTESILSEERKLASQYNDRPSANHQCWINRILQGVDPTK